MKLGFFDKFTSGLLVGGTAAFLLASRIDESVSERVAENWVQFSSVVAAIIAALIALLGVQRQISLQTKLENERRASDLAAAKMQLPLALSEITAFSKSKIQEVFDVSHLADEQKLPTLDSISSGTLDVLKECIKYADPISANKLASIVRIYQVRMVWESDGGLARIRPIPEEQGLEEINAVYHAIEWAVVYAICEDAFDFARGRSRSIPKELDTQKIYQAFNICYTYPENYTSVEERLERYIERGGYAQK